MFSSPASEELTRKGEVGVKKTKYSLADRMRSITLDHMYYIPMAVVISPSEYMSIIRSHRVSHHCWL